MATDRLKQFLKECVCALNECSGSTIKECCGNDIPRRIRALQPNITAGVIVNEVDATGNWVDITVYGDIPANCFREYHSSLTRVELTPSVTSIGNYAFYGCKNIQEITIPETVTFMGVSAFKSCSSLHTLNYNGNVANNGDTNAAAFEGCTALKTLNIGQNVTIIPKSLFAHVDAIETLVIPDNVVTIGKQAFWHCSGLKSVIIGKGVTSIGDEAFASCAALEAVYYNGTNCTYAGAANTYIFESDTALALIAIGDTVENIPSYFAAYTSPDTLVIPDSVKNIGYRAFYKLGTPTVQIGTTAACAIETIDSKAFDSATSVTTIDIHKAEGVITGAPWGATAAAINYIT